MCLYILHNITPSSANKDPVQGVISSSGKGSIEACANFPICDKLERRLLIHGIQNTPVILDAEV
eukprot:3398707-Prorocentrum_lima.AAC.1